MRLIGWLSQLRWLSATIAAAFLVPLVLCTGPAKGASASERALKLPKPSYSDFENPQMVQILGYNDNQGNSNNAMEPFISRDGNFLFFNGLNTAPATSLYWATRVNDVTFQFRGEVGGAVNSGGPLNAVASMDTGGNFYFITTRSYGSPGSPGYLATLYSGPFLNGAVTPVNPVPGMAATRPGLIVFDDEISADGNTLYFTLGDYSTGSLTATTMMAATRRGGGFVVDPNSTRIMHTINNRFLNYAADISADELEFFFTRTNLKVGPEIWTATRKSISKPFERPRQIKAITGFAEAPSISPDGLSLYYHVKNPDGVFVINRVTRTLETMIPKVQSP
ncbi:MAG: TolB-like translocation protein [Candidatus Binataceae bacterium]